MSPLFSAYSSAINQNAALFDRIRTLYEDKAAMAELTPEQQRLVWDYYTDFERTGAALDEPTKARIAELNKELSERYTAFRQNLLHDEQAYVTYLDEDQLGGLPESFIASAKTAAEAKGQPDKWAVTNTRSSIDPFLTYSTERGLREEVWRTYYNRGDNGDEYDNNRLITEILRLREQRSRLQGYDTFADRAVEKNGRQDPGAAAMELMMRVWPAATQRVEEEVADMQSPRHQARGRYHDRALGLPLLRREGPPGALRLRRRGSQSSTSSSRTCARECSGWRIRCTDSSSRGRSRTCPFTTPMSASGR